MLQWFAAFAVELTYEITYRPFSGPCSNNWNGLQASKSRLSMSPETACLCALTINHHQAFNDLRFFIRYYQPTVSGFLCLCVAY
jgi:hypothetical protein